MDKNNLKKAIIFVGIFLLVFYLINIIYIEFVLSSKTIYEKEEQLIKFSVNNNESVKYIFMGDSHVMYGINPKKISGSFNYGFSGDNYIEIYNKLNYLLKTDKNIQNIILQIDRHTFYKDHIFDKIYFFSHFMDYQQIKNVSHKTYLEIFIRKNFPVIGEGIEFAYLPIYKKIPLEFGWVINTKNFLDLNIQKDLKKKMDNYFSDLNKIDDINLKYFKKTINLAHKNNISLILIKMPLTKEYNSELSKINFSEKKYYEKVYSQLNKNKTSILDYYNLFHNNSEYFFDSSHLNEKGANILSEVIDTDLKKINLILKN